ncbi:MAG: AbrB/MazE/SpoVT family DNA-binding domain-containing protein [Thermoplasmata archaeon]
MVPSVRLNAKGQLTVPKGLREKHQLEEGEAVELVDTPDGILIQTNRPTLRASLRSRVDVEALRREVARLSKK